MTEREIELQAKLEQAERQLALFDPAAVAAYVDQRAREAAAKAESALAAAQGAWKALRANILVSDGADKVMRGVWFRGGDAVAQVHAVDAALAAESGKPGGEALNPADLAVEEFVRSDGFQSVRVTHKPTCRYGIGVAPSMVKAKALALEDLRTKMPPAEPRAAPPALPAEPRGEAPVMGWIAWCDHLTAAHEKFRSEVKRLLADGIGPGGGYYAEDQRLTAAVGLLGVGWGACPAPEPGEAKKEGSRHGR